MQPDMNTQQSQGFNNQNNNNNNNNNNGAIDGFTFQRQNDLSGRFLKAGQTFEDIIMMSSLPYEEILAWCTIYRKGVKARIPEMVNHAYHALTASAGADGIAKDYALTSVVGIRAGAMPDNVKRRSFMDKLRGKTTTTVIDQMPTQTQG